MRYVEISQLEATVLHTIHSLNREHSESNVNPTSLLTYRDYPTAPLHWRHWQQWLPVSAACWTLRDDVNLSSVSRAHWCARPIRYRWIPVTMSRDRTVVALPGWSIVCVRCVLVSCRWCACVSCLVTGWNKSQKPRYIPCHVMWHHYRFLNTCCATGQLNMCCHVTWHLNTCRATWYYTKLQLFQFN